MKSLLAIAACLLIGGSSYANFPPNNLHLQDSVSGPSNITEEQFNQITDAVIAAWAPLAKEHGATLVGIKKWKDSTVNAYAEQKGNQWLVTMFGGLARRPEVTLDGFALVACHELGHHFGGHFFVKGNDWAAAEGQADYFATDVCAKKIFSTFNRMNPRFRNGTPPAVKDRCDRVWNNQPAQDLCYRSAAASLSLATLLAVISNITPPKFETPDPNVVPSTNDAHPRPQCRLDTYMAGATCAVPFDVHVIPGKDMGSKNNSKEAETLSYKYSCSVASAPIGARPACWFKPQVSFMGRL